MVPRAPQISARAGDSVRRRLGALLAGASPCRFRFHKAALPMNVPIPGTE